MNAQRRSVQRKRGVNRYRASSWAQQHPTLTPAELELRKRLVDDVAAKNVILPMQFFAPRKADFPEKRLIAAVLKDALDEYFTHCGQSGRRARRLFREAELWIFSEDQGYEDWPFTFEKVCGGLDLESAWVRRMVRQRKEQCLAGSVAAPTRTARHEQRGDWQRISTR